MSFLQESLFLMLATTAVLSAALLLSLWRGFSAALSSRILTLAFLIALLLPWLKECLPAPVHRVAPPEAAVVAQENGESVAYLAESRFPPARSSEQGTEEAGTFLLVVPLAVGGLYLLVALTLLGRLARSHLLAARLWRGSQPVQDPRLLLLSRRLSGEFGCRRLIPMRTTPQTEGPLAMGLVNPGILWPAEQTGLDEAAAEAVLRHELAHVVRRDNLTHLAAALVVSLHWFNPLAWLALRRVRHLTEQACDDLVVTGGVRPSVYARVLLDLARRMSGAQPRLFEAPTASFACQTRHRLVSVLDAGVNRRLPGRRCNVLTVVLFLALILPLTVLRPGAMALSAERASADPFRFLTADSGSGSFGGDWSEIIMEIKEAKALNRWEYDSSLATPLPEGVATHPEGAWTMECHDALALPGSKYGCIFASDEGFVRFSGRHEGRDFLFAVSAVEHGPPSEEDLFFERIAGFFGLGLNGKYRAYQLHCILDGHRGGFDESIRNVFQALVAEAAVGEYRLQAGED